MILGAAALGCAVLLVWGAAAGPVPIVGESQRSSQTPDRGDANRSIDDGDADVRTTPRDTGTAEDEASELPWTNDVVALLLALGLLVLGALLVAVVAAQLGRRRPDETAAPGPAAAYDLEAVRDEIARAAEDQRAALAEGEARDGIIACWVRLEETAARAGAPRSPADTPTEFVVRLLHALDVDPRAVAALAGLYHEARFSTHRMPPDCRARAREALDAIHRDLRVRVS